MTGNREEEKKRAAFSAIDDLIREGRIFSGMKIGLGTGSTAMPAVQRLAERADQVLADIVQVAFDGADDDGALRLKSLRDELRFQYFNAHVHGTRGNQNFRNENFIVFEFFSDDTHTAEQSLVEDGFHRDLLVDRLLHQLLDDLGLTLLQILRNFVQNTHCAFPFSLSISTRVPVFLL